MVKLPMPSLTPCCQPQSKYGPTHDTETHIWDIRELVRKLAYNLLSSSPVQVLSYSIYILPENQKLRRLPEHMTEILQKIFMNQVCLFVCVMAWHSPQSPKNNVEDFTYALFVCLC